MKTQRKPEEKENCERLLRKAAEKSFAWSPGASLEMKEKNSEELLQELQVHQIELEVQNEELSQAQLALEESRQRYAELYDFAPVGYFSFTPEALIKEANLTAAALLGMARQKLINRRFRSFVASSDLDLWDHHFWSVLHQGEKQTCELTLKRQDGSTLQAGLESIQLMVSRGALEIHTVITDITERKGAEEALRKSEEMFSSLFDNAAGGVFQATPEGRLILVNRVFARMFGYESPEEVINTITDITRQIYANPDERKMISGILKEKGYLRNYECQMRRKDGCIFWGSISVRFTETVDGIPCFEGLIIDVSERKRTEEELRESEKRYRDLYDFLPISVYEMDLEANITSANHAIYETFRGTEEDLKKGIKVWQLLSPEDIEKSNKNIQRLIKGEQVLDTEYNLKRLDGTVFPAIVISSVIYSDGKPVGLRGAIVDISERKRAEEKLRESDERYKALFDGSLDLVYITDFEGRFIDANVAALNRLGYTREEIHSLNFTSLLSEDQLPLAFKTLQEIRETGIQKDLAEFRLRHRNGSYVYVETQGSIVMSNGTPVAIQSIARDITERKQAEESLKASENKYRLLADNVNDVIFVLDMNLNYTYVSPSVKFLRGYEAEEVLKQPSFETLTPSSWDLAMRTLSGVMELEKYGSREIPISRTLQLEMRRKEGTTVWTEVKFSFIRDEDQRPEGILGVTRDITDRKRAEEELQRTLKNLRKAFGATIQVMVSAVETRDPYTAGHQLRSADLARAIATEMGFTQDRIDGIRMAGSIHDIGKLSIPAEILSKPAKLSELEFSLIKEHSQKGYDILKDVESPWPLAEMVYQHHERMNGSGYPRNLKGDNILMEARIMAVADVVEAMASYRPYRPALGVDAALEEIEQNKGILYDPEVVEVCLSLFREKGYKLLT